MAFAHRRRWGRAPGCGMAHRPAGECAPLPVHPIVLRSTTEEARLSTALLPMRATAQPVAGVDTVFQAINDPAGDLAQFWVKAVEWEWSQDEASWTGIGGPALAALDRMVASAGRSGLLARTFLASQLHFFFAADQHWCERRLLPLLDWIADAEQAAAAWQGFLTWGRWNDGLRKPVSSPRTSSPRPGPRCSRSRCRTNWRATSPPSRCTPPRIHRPGWPVASSMRPMGCGSNGRTGCLPCCRCASGARTARGDTQPRPGQAQIRTAHGGLVKRHGAPAQQRSPGVVPRHVQDQMGGLGGEYGGSTLEPCRSDDRVGDGLSGREVQIR